MWVEHQSEMKRLTVEGDKVWNVLRVMTKTPPRSFHGLPSRKIQVQTGKMLCLIYLTRGCHLIRM